MIASNAATPPSDPLQEAQAAFDAAMKDPVARQRLKNAVTKTAPRIESEIARIEGSTPDNGTKLPRK